MIHLEDKYYLQSTQYGWTLVTETGNDKEGNPIYKPLGYFCSLSRAIKAYINRRVSNRICEGTFEFEEAVQILQEENKRFEILLETVQRGILNGTESI